MFWLLGFILVAELNAFPITENITSVSDDNNVLKVLHKNKQSVYGYMDPKSEFYVVIYDLVKDGKKPSENAYPIPLLIPQPNRKNSLAIPDVAGRRNLNNNLQNNYKAGTTRSLADVSAESLRLESHKQGENLRKFIPPGSVQEENHKASKTLTTRKADEITESLRMESHKQGQNLRRFIPPGSVVPIDNPLGIDSSISALKRRSQVPYVPPSIAVPENLDAKINYDDKDEVDLVLDFMRKLNQIKMTNGISNIPDAEAGKRNQRDGASGSTD